MNFPPQEQVEALRRRYPPGTRLQLISMQDAYATVLPGTKGTVTTVDDAGTIHMKWDNGRTLGLIPGEDSYKKVGKPKEHNHAR